MSAVICWIRVVANQVQATHSAKILALAGNGSAVVQREVAACGTSNTAFHLSLCQPGDCPPDLGWVRVCEAGRREVGPEALWIILVDTRFNFRGRRNWGEETGL
jgi:hypothetical protein